MKTLTPTESWKVLTEDPDSFLIDVRTYPEWLFTGIPDLSSINKNIIKISFREYSEMQYNPFFIANLEAELSNKNSVLIFICRSGHRSHEAGQQAINAGFLRSYNMIYGFEGELDSLGHRSSVNGWKKDQLPWRQT